MPPLSLPVVALFAVFVLIAVRQVGRFRFRIWHAMLGGALVALAYDAAIGFSSGDFSQAVSDVLAINLDVHFFLFGMFVIGEALAESGYLHHLAHKLFRKSKSVDHLVLLILFSMGLLSALLMNDTLAIIGTPLMLVFARRFEISPKLLLLTLAFAVTTGSAMSAIGNPQNLLIALNGNVPNPFVTFLFYLGVPTLLNLLVCYAFLRLFYKKEFKKRELEFPDEPIKDLQLARLSKASLAIVVSLIALKVALALLGIGIDFRLTYIALISAAPIIIFSARRAKVVRGIDWSTLVFFAAMFVLMASVWGTGFFQQALAEMSLDVASVPAILVVSALVSQLVSNVPFVALYIPILLQSGAGTVEMMALAAGATIAGNMLILGAASNVIIVQRAEREGETLTFWEFARIGVPLTIVNICIYWAWLSVF